MESQQFHHTFLRGVDVLCLSLSMALTVEPSASVGVKGSEKGTCVKACVTPNSDMSDGLISDIGKRAVGSANA